MVRGQRVRTARAAGGQGVTRDDQQNRPCEKIIVRLRPVLQDELANGETQSALTTTHRYAVRQRVSRTLCETEAKVEFMGLWESREWSLFSEKTCHTAAPS